MATPSDADAQKYRYRMDHPKRGKFIIINNKEFNPETRMGKRDGTDLDATKLEMTFRMLGFEVERYNDQTRTQMLQLMIAASKFDHSQYDCFGVAVLSHGMDAKLFGTDGLIDIESFVDPLKSCSTLFKKPKLFFIQACRGDKFDDGNRVEADSGETGATPPRQVLLPQEADFLYAYSTVPGYYSWRNNQNGSWFVQALCTKLIELAFKDIDLLRILTRVSHQVATDFESSSSVAPKKKQIPSIVSMLTKDVYFTRKA